LLINYARHHETATKISDVSTASSYWIYVWRLLLHTTSSSDYSYLHICNMRTSISVARQRDCAEHKTHSNDTSRSFFHFCFIVYIKVNCCSVMSNTCMACLIFIILYLLLSSYTLRPLHSLFRKNDSISFSKRTLRIQCTVQLKLQEN